MSGNIRIIDNQKDHESHMEEVTKLKGVNNDKYLTDICWDLN